MPTLIKPYDAGNLTLQPTERGVDARLQEARRTAGFYDQAANEISRGAQARSQAQGDIDRSFAGAANATAAFAKQQEDFAGHREISKGAAAGAQLFSDLNDRWNETVNGKQDANGNWIVPKADPNDPSVAAKFRETVLEPKLQQFQESYSTTDRGQLWSEQHVANMRNHFFQKTAADMTGLAADAVRVNVRQVANSSSNTAFKSPDFHTVDFLLKNTDASIDGIVSSSNVKGADGARLRTEVAEKTKEQIVKSAAQGAIMRSADPEKTAQSFADRYPTYINGAEEKQFAMAARAQAKTNVLQDKQLQREKQHQEDLEVHQATAKVLADNFSVDPVDPTRVRIKPEAAQQALDIARKYPNSAIAASNAHTALTWIERQQDRKAQPIVSDPAVKADLLTRMTDPTNPTKDTEIMRAGINGSLADHEATKMLQLRKAIENEPIKEHGFHDTLAAAKGVLTYTLPGMPLKDPKGLENYAAFVNDFIPKFQAASRTGTLQPNALDTRDPTSLISQTMKNYKRDPLQIVKDRQAELASFKEGNLTGEDKTVGASEVIDIPAGMSPAEAVKAFGKGKTIRLPDGRTKVLQ